MVVGPGVDYYDDLGLTRVASTTDIKRAYRKLSLKYHPDQDASPEASVAWMRVSEAYDVLSQPKLKGFFDLYGEEGLKDGVSDGRGGVKGGFYTFSRDPLAIFELPRVNLPSVGSTWAIGEVRRCVPLLADFQCHVGIRHGCGS